MVLELKLGIKDFQIFFTVLLSKFFKTLRWYVVEFAIHFFQNHPKRFDKIFLAVPIDFEF